MRTIAAALLGAAMLASGSAGLSPAAHAEGIFNAVSFDPLPQGRAIAVSPMDDSPENMSMKRDIEDALRRAGYGVAERSDLVLSFETRHVLGTWTEGERRTLLEVEGRTGTTANDDAKARLNMFNSERGGLLNRGESETSMRAEQSRQRVEVTLDDRTGGKRLWQAWAVAPIEGTGSAALGRAVAEVVAGHLGRTAKRQVFAVP